MIIGERNKLQQIKREQERKIEAQHQATLKNRLKVNVLTLRVGYELIKLAEHYDSPLMENIRGIRVNIANEYGFAIPKINIVPNPYMDFPSNGYEILLKGVKIGSGKVEVDKFLMISMAGKQIRGIKGIRTKDPVSNSDALWIDEKDKDEAILRGDCVVVNAQAVISTHISELIRQYMGEMITHQDVRDRIDMLQDEFPVLVEEILEVPLRVIHQVLKDLLHDGIPIKDIITILETIIKVIPEVKYDEIAILDYVRSALAMTITDIFKSEDGSIKFFTLPEESESYLNKKVSYDRYNRRLSLTSDETNELAKSLNEMAQKALKMQITPILVVSVAIRYALAKFAESDNIDIVVLSCNEISTSAKIKHLGNIELKFES